MKLGLKQVSWRTTGIVVLGLTLIASLAFNFLALHPTAKATANATRHGTIAPGKSQVKVTATGQVDWSKLPKVTSGAAVTRGKQVATNLDRMTPKQRAAYVANVKSGKIKSPFAPTQTLPSTTPKATVPNPNFDACGYTNLPCKVYGFAGMNSTTAGNWYPPDQALAVNSSQVMEGVNNAYALYSFSGSAIYGPTSSTTFFASIIHSGDFLSDPQMFWDASRQHFIIVEIEINQSGSTTTDYYDVAVSKAQNGNVGSPSVWYLYQFAANVNVGGTANWCDYPTMGSDYWGLWLDCVAFSQASSSFLGNAVFALNKTALYAGNASALNITYWTQIPNGVSNGSGGYEPAYRLSNVNEDGTPDAEFLVATDAGYGGPYTDLTTAAFTNTHAITLGAGNSPTLSYVITTLPISYTDPINAAQPGTTVGVYPGSGTKQIEYQGGNLYIALTTAVNSGTHDGVYWAEVQPQLTGLDPAHPGNQVVATAIVRQAGIWAYSNADAYMGTFEASSADDEVLSFNISSSSIYPSIAYTGRRATDALNTMGDGNNYLYAVTGTNSNDSQRWGDYSACALTLNLTTRGLIFCAGEYGGPTTKLGGTGWDTYIYGLRTE